MWRWAVYFQISHECSSLFPVPLWSWAELTLVLSNLLSVGDLRSSAVVLTLHSASESPGGPVRTQNAGLPWGAWAGWRICISDKSLEEADAAVLGALI